jgi:hypothetical protein
MNRPTLATVTCTFHLNVFTGHKKSPRSTSSDATKKNVSPVTCVYDDEPARNKKMADFDIGIPMC